ncbi:chorismate synthase [Silvibacterium bohemicum]|uniref:Chorismate synthase n=1 Tax=Silvibacterium bohemicum TaxID=1577686 RepID=A0A841JN13_9BACT|nr:hypothetical protein [Silvibacterium bohemicum]MBB6142633.1 chorismate synthase [Silvibacterium bohemicum]
MAKSKYKKTNVYLPDRELALYVGAKIHAALAEITMDMDLYKGVRLGQVLEAVYEQGMKDGRREIIESLEVIKSKANYLPPGRPKKKKKS